MELHSCFQYSNPNVQKGSTENILFQGSRGDPTFSSGGGSSFFQGEGVQILISIEPHITCDFLWGGGSRPPIPPMDVHINTETVILIETGV